MLVSLLILLIVAVVAIYIVRALPLPEPIKTVALLVVGLLILITLIRYLGVFGGPILVP